MLELACEAFASPEDVRKSDCNCQWPATDTAIQDLIDEASDVLVQITHGWFRGRCNRSVYPCLQGRLCPCSCGCGRSGGIELGGFNPEVSEVVLNGVTLTEDSDWEQLHGSLYRISDAWPQLANKRGGPVLRVTYEHGRAVRTTARNAAVELVCMLYQDGDKPGQELSTRVRRTTVDNVVMELDDPDPQDTAGSGLKFVKAFLDLYNAGGDGSFVWSPDLEPQWSLELTTAAS